MRTKIVYVIVSKKEDIYIEQLYLSLLSLKRHSPNSSSTVVTDCGTGITLKSVNLDLQKYIDELIEVEVPQEYKGAQCSRYLKSSLRKYVSGPYLFVDTDTIIAESLDDIDELIDKEVDIAAVKDGHCYFKEMPNYSEIIERAHKIGWDDMINDNIHFNSGVMFVSDSKKAYDFYDKWHKNWLLEYKKGFFYDQLALAHTNQELGYFITEMEGIWNFQLFWGALRFLHRSKIIHYGGYGIKEPYFFSNKSVLVDIKTHGELTEEMLNHICNPKEAYIGLSKVVGQSDINYYRSILHYDYLRHPKRFRFYEDLVVFIHYIGRLKLMFVKKK